MIREEKVYRASIDVVSNKLFACLLPIHKEYTNKEAKCVCVCVKLNHLTVFKLS